MKTWSLVSGIGLIVVLSGCGGSGSDDGTESGTGAFSAGSGSSGSSTPSNIATGDYVLDTSDVSATLNVRTGNATSVKYTLAVFQKTDASGFASLHDRTARRDFGVAFDDVIEVGCQVSLQPAAGNTVKLTVTGPCTGAGLGAFSHGSGSYKKGDTHGCVPGTTFDSESARCAGSGGQNDPADNHGCPAGSTFDPESARCAGSGGQNDPLEDDHGCAPGTTFDAASARCAGSGGQNDPNN